jgi:hypothetical protein
VDCVCASSVTPKVMVGFLTGNKVISYKVCGTHMFFASFSIIEDFLLALMAFHCHLAVCRPLHYITTMTSILCVLVVDGSYITGLMETSIHVALTFHPSFCHSNVINHFFLWHFRGIVFSNQNLWISLWTQKSQREGKKFLVNKIQINNNETDRYFIYKS